MVWGGRVLNPTPALASLSPGTVANVPNEVRGVVRFRVRGAGGLRKGGSAREFVRSGILRGLPHFLKSDEFGVRGSHALYLQE